MTKLLILPIFFCTLVFASYFTLSTIPTFVSVRLHDQFGNQLFQIAAAYAYSLDHKLPLIIPQLANDEEDRIASNAQKLYLNKINHGALPREPSIWKERFFHRYLPIPKKTNLQLEGYFSNEQYFKHRRKEILELFAPPSEMKKEILSKYPFLDSGALTVAVQIRDYRKAYPQGKYHPTHGREYYAKALALFPDEAIFLVSSNNLPFAKECTSGLKEKIIYLEEQDDIKEFYTLALCKAFVISNSTFGWWAAWLSTNEDKIVVVPSPWFAPPYRPNHARSLIPEKAVVIESQPL